MPRNARKTTDQSLPRETPLATTKNSLAGPGGRQPPISVKKGFQRSLSPFGITGRGQPDNPWGADMFVHGIDIRDVEDNPSPALLWVAVRVCDEVHMLLTDPEACERTILAAVVQRNPGRGVEAHLLGAALLWAA